MLQAIQVILLFAIPVGIMMVSKKVRFLQTLSPILLCYAIGILWGNLKFLPLDRGLSMTLSEVAVPIAIPLILFSANFRKFLHSAKAIVISFFLIILSAIVSSTAAGLIFRGVVEEYAKIGGMLVGVYTGGTPNLMAIGMGLQVKPETLILVNACDAILGGLFFLFIISGLKPLLSKFLKPYRKGPAKPEDQQRGKNTFSLLSGKQKKKAILGIVIAVLICIGVLGLAVGLSLLVTGRLDTAIIMLIVTTVGVVGSFLGPIKKIRYTYEAGQYAIFVFSIALGTLVDIETMLTTTPVVLGFTAVAMFGALILHLSLAKLLKIDVDTAIITSSAGIYGPAFIGPIADALKNRDMIVPGLTCGLVGYAVGNYLGYFVYQMLSLL
ncbi:MAG: DUF819 family protein [Clostridia bacterium]